GLDLKPGSPLLERLEQAGAPPGVRCIAVHSAFDQFIIPAELAFWRSTGVENIEVTAVGHNRLVWSKEVFRRVWERMEESAREREEAGPDSASPPETPQAPG
ncbi:MAG: hypothetical protein ACE5JJ_08250, partial [Nitrospinota bacterium]